MTIRSVYLAPIQVDIARGQIHVVPQDKCVEVTVRNVQFVQVAQRVVVMGVIQVALKYVVLTIKQFVMLIKRVAMAIVVMQVRHV
jgi:hypothetical protein